MHDVIVLGLGGMGSSSVFHLAQKSVSVLGIEQFEIAHAKGSSHGESRLIRKAYFEHPNYVPLLERSYLLWGELSKASGKKLLHQTGLVIYGPEKGGKVLPGVRSAANLHGLKIEEYSAGECEKRFPKLKVPEGFVGIYEPTGGYLELENSISAYCELAKKNGASLHFNEKVTAWKKEKNTIRVTTDKNEYLTKKLVITAGPWSQEILGDIGVKLTVKRVPMFWFPTTSGFAEKEGMPSFAYDLPWGFIYGFPNIAGQGVKISPHLPGSTVTDPYKIDREVQKEELDPVTQCINKYLPGVDPTPTKSVVCMYTMSPDSHFIIDQHPSCEGVYLAAGFSGHGYKFASVIGEVMSDLSTTGKTDQPIDFLRIRR